MHCPRLLLPSVFLLLLACSSPSGGSGADGGLGPEADAMADAVPPQPDADLDNRELLFQVVSGVGQDRAEHLAARDGGGILAMGRSDSNLDLGGGELDAREGMLQLWVASYDGNQEHKFSQMLVPLEDQAVGYLSAADDIAPDGIGGAWVAATLVGGVTVDDTVIDLAGGQRAHVLLHFDSDGNLVEHWLFSTINAGTSLFRQHLAYDGAGSVYLASYLYAPLGAPLAPLGLEVETNGWHLAKFNAQSGEGEWVTALTGSAVQVTDLRASASGLWLAGTMRGSVSIRDASLVRQTFADAPFVVNLSPLAAGSAGGFVVDDCECHPSLLDVSIDVAANGEVAATWTRFPIGAAARFVVARFGTTGDSIWMVESAGTASTVLNTLDLQGDQLLLAGRGDGGTLGEQELTGLSGPLLVALDWSSGNVVAARTQPSEASDRWARSAITASGQLVLAGGFVGPVDLLGSVPFSATGLADVVIGWFPLPL